MSFVYFIQPKPAFVEGVGEVVKIGVAADLMKRLKTLQTGCPLPLTLVRFVRFEWRRDAQDEEHRLHAVFKDQRLRGEWFVIEDALREFMLTKTSPADGFDSPKPRSPRVYQKTDFLWSAPEAARGLLNMLKKAPYYSLRTRDVYRRQRRFLKTPQQVQVAVDLLCHSGRARVINRDPVGRKPEVIQLTGASS